MPVFTDALDVDPGGATKASDHDKLADNTEFNRETANANHDFAISTGDGGHVADPAQPMKIKNSLGTVEYSLAVHQAGDGSNWLLLRTSDQSSVTQANCDGYFQLGESDDVPA